MSLNIKLTHSLSRIIKKYKIIKTYEIEWSHLFSIGKKIFLLICYHTKKKNSNDKICIKHSGHKTVLMYITVSLSI